LPVIRLGRSEEGGGKNGGAGRKRRRRSRRKSRSLTRLGRRKKRCWKDESCAMAPSGGSKKANEIISMLSAYRVRVVVQSCVQSWPNQLLLSNPKRSCGKRRWLIACTAPQSSPPQLQPQPQPDPIQSRSKPAQPDRRPLTRTLHRRNSRRGCENLSGFSEVVRSL
jgi:hypothetical protein